MTEIFPCTFRYTDRLTWATYKNYSGCYFLFYVWPRSRIMWQFICGFFCISAVRFTSH